MNPTEAHAVLVKSFRALDDEQRARLLRHAEKGTPICCGERWSEVYAPLDGAG